MVYVHTVAAESCCHTYAMALPGRDGTQFESLVRILTAHQRRVQGDTALDCIALSSCTEGSAGVGGEGQSMPNPSLPSLMASFSILCSSSYESYVGRHSWLKLDRKHRGHFL